MVKPPPHTHTNFSGYTTGWQVEKFQAVVDTNPFFSFEQLFFEKWRERLVAWMMSSTELLLDDKFYKEWRSLRGEGT